VDLKEILENDFNLNISHYVRTAEAAAAIDLAAKRRRSTIRS